MKHVVSCYLVVLFLILIFSFVELSARPKIPIGGIFHDDNHETEIAFRTAVRRQNKYNPFFELVPVSHFISNSDSFKTWKAVCNLTEYGVAAIVGPFSRLTSFVSGSICDYTGIPNIQGHWDHNAMDYQMTVNVYPDPNTLSESLVDIFEWHSHSYVIIYDTVDAVVRLHSLLQKHTAEDPPITLRQLSPDGDYRPMFKDLRDHSVTRIVLDCEPELIPEVLRQAKLLDMLGDYHSYLLISFDAHTLDLSPFKNDLSNVTSIRLVNTGSYEVGQAVNDFLKSSRKPNERIPNVTPDTLKTETALVYDAVTLLHDALLTYYHSVEEDKFIPQKFMCNNLTKGTLNKEFLNIIKDTVIEEGLTGPVELDANGRRTIFNLELTELSNAKFQTIATYSSNTNELEVTMTEEERESIIATNIKNKTFRVVSRLGPPYLTRVVSKDGKPLEGNDKWEGYSKDLIQLIANALEFKFDMYVVKDNKYGRYDPINKRWDGLMGDLVQGKADLAACDLTITSQRIDAVDFTMPFMTLGISILFDKNIKKAPRLFTFMDPFNRNVWIYTATAYFGISLLIFVLARLSPEERKPAEDKPLEYQRKWTLVNCLWVCMRCLLSAGCIMFPRSRSLHLIMIMWWFFVLVMNNTYKANMAAFLTRSKMATEIKNVYDLANQNKIKYGVVDGGSTAEFFRASHEPMYRKMYTTMSQASPTVLMDNNLNGMLRVIKSRHKYAFLMESTSLEYLMYRDCRLKQVGGLLDKKSYGLALPKNSQYRSLISAQLSKLKEKGKLNELKKKWWETENLGEGCEGVTIPEEDFKQLEHVHVKGVYIVLYAGITLAVFITIGEFIWHAREVFTKKKVPIKVTLKKETVFALKFWLNRKPANIRSKRLLNELNNVRNIKETNLAQAATTLQHRELEDL